MCTALCVRARACRRSGWLGVGEAPCPQVPWFTAEARPAVSACQLAAAAHVYPQMLASFLLYGERHSGGQVHARGCVPRVCVCVCTAQFLWRHSYKRNELHSKCPCLYVGLSAYICSKCGHLRGMCSTSHYPT